MRMGVRVAVPHFLLVSVFCACSSLASVDADRVASTAADAFWLTPPQPGSLHIIGVSGRQSSREAEIENAREDAARKAAMYHGVTVSHESVQEIGSGFLDYYASSETHVDYDEDLEPYMDRLTFDPRRDLLANERGVFIRFSYPALFPGRIAYSFSRNPDHSPVWISHQPQEINGFMAGVGYAARQFRTQDTFAISCNSAAASIVSHFSTTLTSTGISAESWNASVINQTSEGRLSHFLVLEIWIDPRTQAVWTLAIAQGAY